MQRLRVAVELWVIINHLFVEVNCESIEAIACHSNTRIMKRSIIINHSTENLEKVKTAENQF